MYKYVTERVKLYDFIILNIRRMKEHSKMLCVKRGDRDVKKEQSPNMYINLTIADRPPELSSFPILKQLGKVK